LTEANLGDGLPRLPTRERGAPPLPGTDSNARISMVEEMRWSSTASVARKRAGAGGLAGEVARGLLAAATTM
jgi:hypothetical protein